MNRLLPVIWYYLQARRRKFKTRAALEQFQEKAINRHLQWVAHHSPFYRNYEGRPLQAWPMADKLTCLAAFNEMNTAKLHLEEARNFALAAEESRDFTAALHGYTVGLSSGTSGTRGLFVANARERALWAGLALSKLLPEGLFKGERIAFFLRANSTLYTSVESPWVSFKFFDLMAPLAPQLPQLSEFKPTVIVAPAQVLRYLALQRQAGLSISPKKVVSVAEVLEASDREILQASFAEIAEVYQATEGFLGCTCSHGRLHLNEEYLHVEPEWLDATQTRMVPIITDFSRTTQPVIRYRLNDVLAVDPTPCPCGNPSRGLRHIEGRCDDQFNLPAIGGGTLPVFADALSRALLRALPLEADYRLVQTHPDALLLTAALGSAKEEVVSRLNPLLFGLGVDTAQLRWTLEDAAPGFDPGTKRRRIVNKSVPMR